MESYFGLMPLSYHKPLIAQDNLGDVVDAAAARDNIGAASKQEVLMSANPLGTIIAFYGREAPFGYLPCIGQTISSSVFPDLVGFLNPGQPTATLPDLRSEFLRGWDNGRGVDVNRVLGSWQNYDFHSHTHSTTAADAGSHTHTGTNSSEGGHTHAGTAVSSGAHTHTAGSNAEGSHTHTGTATDNGYHAHAVSTSSEGSHTHNTWTGESGYHGHSAWTDSQGNHRHQVGPYSGRGTTSRDEPWEAVSDGGSYTDEAGAHSHNVGIAGDGTHTHGIGMDAAGYHAHTVYLNADGTHSHSLTVNSGGSHTHSIWVNSSDNHSHTLSMDSASAHTHSLTISSNGTHSHTMTVANVGGVETRPRNVAVLFCIKAYGSVVSEANLDIAAVAAQLDLKVKLADFTGTNQSLSANGYQKLPGGLILQWFSSTLTSDDQQVNYPIAFPNEVFSVVGTQESWNESPVGVVNKTTSGFLAQGFTARATVGATSLTVNWIALGK